MHGHQTGDRVLERAAQVLRDETRTGELIARVGGEEFAMILPDADGEEALRAAERVRRAIAATEFPAVGRMTLSAGVCDLEHAEDADALYRLADGALYLAKHRGRDRVVRYTPGVAKALSAREQAERLERQQALVSVRLLARVVDAKDPSTRRHSERVGDLCAEIAEELGWSPERAALLREAGLVHDVGKIGVPDEILLAPRRLTDDEYAQITEHAALGSRIVGEALSPEQVSWVRGHHERWDGTGYPDGLQAEESPEGARILALADAWDVMTSERPYTSAPSTPAEAIAECRACAGTQFWPPAVEALAAPARGGVTPPGRRLALAAVGVAGLAVAGLLGLAVALNGEDEPARPGLRVVVEPAGVVTSVPARSNVAEPVPPATPQATQAAPPAPGAQRTVTPVAPRVVVDRAPETDPGDATAPRAPRRLRPIARPVVAPVGATPPPAVVAPPPVAPLVAPSTPVVDPPGLPDGPRRRAAGRPAPRGGAPGGRTPRPGATGRGAAGRSAPGGRAPGQGAPGQGAAGQGPAGGLLRRRRAGRLPRSGSLRAEGQGPRGEGRGPGLSRGCRPAALPREEPRPLQTGRSAKVIPRPAVETAGASGVECTAYRVSSVRHGERRGSRGRPLLLGPRPPAASRAPRAPGRR